MNQNQPILVIAYNRPDYLNRVINKLKLLSVPKVYFFVDGPKKTSAWDISKNNEVKKIIESIDWIPTKKELFLNYNHGCRYAPPQAISWAMENEESLIVLEDDCIPSLDFINFCTSMLYHYKNDNRVMMISGSNFIPDNKQPKNASCSYAFVRYYNVWGWATWKRAWDKYRVDMPEYDEVVTEKKLRELFNSERIRSYYIGMFHKVLSGFETWDIQWWYCCIMNSGLCILPRKNLVENIGTIGTHSRYQKKLGINRPASSIKNINLAEEVFINHKIESLIYKYSHAQIDEESFAQNFKFRLLQFIVRSTKKFGVYSFIKKYANRL